MEEEEWMFQWCQIYSSGLTRAKHAFFDEFNVLETYQPRARTMGHLFMVIFMANNMARKFNILNE